MKPVCFFKNVFLDEKKVLIVILLNAVVLFLQESGVEGVMINVSELVFTLFFIVEMIVKQATYGIREYWKSGWNKLDGVLVIVSLPSVVVYIFPVLHWNMSFLLVLRVLRVFRFFRVIHAFPDFPKIMKNFAKAMRLSYSIFIGMLIMILVFSMISCVLFGKAAPEYFATPLDAIYTTFRLFTGEGWNEIPDTIALAMGTGWGHLIRLYFCALLLIGCIIGMSLLNSIFVDAMVSDNNDELENEVKALNEKIDYLTEQITKQRQV